MEKNKAENFWLNLGFNIIAPSLMLIKGRALFARLLGDSPNIDLLVFVAALLFPISYGVFDLLSRRKWNLFSIIGLASVLLTGGFGLMSLSKNWIIAKEALVPLVLGAAVLATARTRRPLAKMIILSESVFDVPKIESALDARGSRREFDAQMKSITCIIAASFLLSSVLNFALASYIFTSPAGTPEFNEQLGKMTALSYPVIVLPTMAVFVFAMLRFFKALDRLTGLKIDEIVLKK